MGGLRHLTGEPGRVPVRVGVSHRRHAGGAARRDRRADGAAPPPGRRRARARSSTSRCTRRSSTCMESLLPEYDAFGAVREPAGSALPGIAPTNAYRCSDGGYVLIAGNGDSIFKRLMAAIGRADLGERSGARRQRRPRRSASTRSTPPSAHGPRQHSVDEVLAVLDARRRARRPHLHGRRHRGRPALPGARACCSRCAWTTAARSRCRASCPSCRSRPAAIAATRRDLGQDTDEVLRELGLTAGQIEGLKRRGIVAGES